MFGKKKDAEKAVSKTPFPLQVLTTGYLIEGTASADQQFFLPAGTDYWYPIELTAATITSTGADDLPVRKADKFEVKGDTVVAMIPRTDVTKMLQYESYLAYKKSLKGIFYIGPYLFEGTLMSFENDRFNSSILMLDVKIRHASSKSKLDEISASHVLVNTKWLHGREVK